MTKKTVARETLERRLRVAKDAMALCHDKKISIKDACQEMGLCRSYLDSTIREWRHGWIAEDSKQLASHIISIILEVNATSYGGAAKYKSWEDIEANMVEAPALVPGDAFGDDSPVEPEQMLLPIQPGSGYDLETSAQLGLVMQVTGQTEKEVQQAAVRLYCKQVLADYVSKL